MPPDRCYRRCWTADGEPDSCKCICGGRYHGKGIDDASREIAEELGLDQDLVAREGIARSGRPPSGQGHLFALRVPLAPDELPIGPPAERLDAVRTSLAESARFARERGLMADSDDLTPRQKRISQLLTDVLRVIDGIVGDEEKRVDPPLVRELMSLFESFAEDIEAAREIELERLRTELAEAKLGAQALESELQGLHQAIQRARATLGE